MTETVGNLYATPPDTEYFTDGSAEVRNRRFKYRKLTTFPYLLSSVLFESYILNTKVHIVSISRISRI